MAQTKVFAAREARLTKRLRAEGLNGVVIVPGANMKYFADVESFLLERPFMLFVPASGAAHLVAPEMESGPYRRSPMEMTIHAWTDSEGPSDAIVEAVKAVGFEGAWGVEGRAPFAYLNRLVRASRARLKDGEPLLQGLREIKDDAEMKLMRKSAEILSKSFRQFPDLVRDGMTEMELGRVATQAIYDNGATKVDDMLVQSGARAADPHSLPSVKKVRKGESIIIDVGATYLGYYSDITRTFCLGSAGEVEKVYSAVLEGQREAILASEEGVEVGKVDEAARNVLEKAGYGKEFFHRTGHGLGLEIHEGPYIVSGGTERLREGMCFTVEPGAYLKNRLGVRIEDDVTIAGKAGEELTRVPKEYGWWR